MIIENTIKAEDGSDISIQFSSVIDAKAQVILAHGAGANMSHEFMDEISLLLNQLGINVIRFNFPFMDKRLLTGKKYPPDRMPKLLACYKTVVEYVIESHTDKLLPLYIGGKSMGSRVAATLIASDEILNTNHFQQINGVFCLGYPFHPAKKEDKLRLDPLVDANKSVLIVQGERDALGNQTEINSYQLPKHCHCVFLPDGDHSLKPRVKSGFTYKAHMKKAADEIVNFIASVTP